MILKKRQRNETVYHLTQLIFISFCIFQMLMLMEQMFYELELVEELNIHPDTLKRFLVSKT